MNRLRDGGGKSRRWRGVYSNFFEHVLLGESGAGTIRVNGSTYDEHQRVPERQIQAREKFRESDPRSRILGVGVASISISIILLWL